jgi:23S rRNA (cytosine1962-C5)-methyltransferase
MYRTVYLKPGKEESLLRFHPWIFSGAIHHIDNGISEGDVVRVVTSDGRYAATGHYQGGSIAVRVLSFTDIPIDAAFWQQRLKAALEARKAMGFLSSHSSPLTSQLQTTAFRLVHGEGDMLSGLIIDIYGRTAVMQAHSIGMHRSRREIAGALAEVMSDYVANIYYKSETTLPFMETENGFLLGGSEDDTALENGLRFHVDWLKGQKTGFFVDQRENRALVEHYSEGRTVLNMFCYTGGFSFYAMRGGARLVHSVDSSVKAVELTRRNVELNFPGDRRHKAFCEDAFKFLDGIGSRDAGTPANSQLSTLNSQLNYDLIILDPPAFAKHRGALHNALKGYTRLNKCAFAKIAPGGLLFTFSCSQVVTKDNFRNAVFTAAAQAGRNVRILHQLHQPADHPINIYHPEGEYLKGLVLYVE